ncbi:hypothetical protein M0R19_01750 [Candidatus Pacearchaeota archaeon]|jgi:hypothetical protein|nr:hypothetical protein [Candidatus Pacearchaeota archaeon]
MRKTILSLLVLASLGSCALPNYENKIFDHHKHKEKMLKQRGSDENNDGSLDRVTISYDFNKDEIPDYLAVYRIVGENKGKELFHYNAVSLMKVNKKGKIKYALFDTDFNGTLDKKIKTKKEFEEFMKKIKLEKSI